jgi:hypothetical protein
VVTVLPSGVTRHQHRRISAETLFGHIRAPVRNIQGHVEGKSVDSPVGHRLALGRALPHDVRRRKTALSSSLSSGRNQARDIFKATRGKA